MKKFVDPYAGIAFDTIEDALDDFCKRTLTGNNCGSMCAIGSQTFQSCREWAKKHPDEAADIMSLDVVEVEVMPTPRLAEVLGVKVGQKIRIVGGDFDTVEFCIQEDGEPSTYIHAALPYAINHPESIIHLQRLTEPEIAIMRSLGAKWVSRDPRSDSQVELYSEKPAYRADGEFVPQSGKKCVAVIYDAKIFPSVKPGDCLCLDGGPYADAGSPDGRAQP